MPVDAQGISVLVIGEGAVAGRARGRLEAAGYRVAEAAWTRSSFEEIERASRGSSALPAIVLAFPASPTEIEEARSARFLDRVAAGGLVLLSGAVPPAVAVSLGEAAAKRGLAFVDAPAHAEGSTIPVGGAAADVDHARTVLECLGTPVLQGDVGTGQQARLCAQIALAAAIIGGCEALAYARAAGLDLDRVLQVLPASDGLLADRFRRLARGEHGDTETVAEIVAAVGTALADAESVNLDLPGAELSQLLFGEVADMGLANDGAESLAALWQDDDDAPDLVQIGPR